MNFREFLKKILSTYLDIKKYGENNLDITKKHRQHYLNYGFNEARPTFFNLENEESKLVPALEIQYLRSNKIPSISIIPEYFNGTPSPCSYIRIIFPLQYLEFLNEINLNDKNDGSKIWVMNRLPRFHANIYEWIFSLSPSDLILYDIDDDLISHYGPSSDQSKIIITMLLLADKVTVSTKSLHKNLKKFNNNTIIRNNFSLHNLIATESDFKNEYKILYMGTSTHEEDFLFIYDALVTIARKYTNIKISIIGLEITTKIEQIKNIEILSSYYPQFIERYKKIGYFKIGIIPLIENTINKSKSNIKYYDYLSKCEYILTSDVGEYKNSKLPRLKVVKSNDKNTWANEIEKTLTLPNLNQDQINKSFILARKIKFKELEKLSTLVYSMSIGVYKIINIEMFRYYFTEEEIYQILKNRFIKGVEAKLLVINNKDSLVAAISNSDYLVINFSNIKITLKEMIDTIISINKNFVLEINIFKSNSEYKNQDSLLISNLKFIRDHTNLNLVKSTTEVRFLRYDVYFISFSI